MAALAELDAGLISERTALQAAKARGTKLGNPRPAAAARKALAARATTADQFAASLVNDKGE